MAIKTRETDGTGVTNKGAPLTNAELDNNFIELVADIASATSDVVDDTTPQLGGNLDTNGNDITFGDNDKAIFGAGSDLQIYHNGTHSYISEVGTGRLYIMTNGDEIRLTPQSGAENGLRVQQDGAVKLYYDNAEKFTTTTTGIDVTGTVTADGLTVDGTATAKDIVISDVNPTFGLYETDTVDQNTLFDNGGGDLYIQTVSDSGSTRKTRIVLDHATGDISFYEDTGTTAKFFWDASAESLGIGTSSPNLHGWTTAVTLNTSSNGGYEIGQSGTKYGAFALQGDGRVQLTNFTANPLTFQTNNAERMRIDSSGNLLVGKTAVNANTLGFEARPDGIVAMVRDSGNPLYVDRLTNDGELVNFRKDNTTVGSIGTTGGYFIAGSGDTALRYHSGVDLIHPCGTDGATRDGVISFGNSTNRFKNLYLSGGVYLGGTGSANYLDDYETGTWTPTSFASGYTASTAVGSYTKIGNMVYVTCYFSFSSVGTNNSGCVFGGLPFAANANPTAGNFRDNSSTGTIYVFRIAGNSSLAEINSYSGVTAGSARTIRTGEQYIGFAVYQTAS